MNAITRSFIAALAFAGAGAAEEIRQAEPASGQTKVEVGPISVSVSVTGNEPGKTAKTPYLGVATGMVSPQLRAQLDLPEGMGLSVEAVAKDSPADKAGIKKYDVLKKFNDQMLCAQEQLSVLVNAAGKDAKVTLVVLRGGREQTLSVVLGEHDAPEAGKARFSINGVPGLTIDVQNLDKMLKGAFSGNIGPETFSWTGPAGAAGSAGIHQNWDEWRKKSAQQKKEIQEQIDAATRKAREAADKARGDAKKAVEAAGAAKAQVFSFYPGAQSQSVVTVVDSDGTIEINDSNGKRTVKIKDPSGKEVHSGPLNTEADRNAVPENFRAKVKDAESKIKPGGAADFKKKPMKKPEPNKEPGGTI